jgi:Na+/citrate or Na+/malate symporter
MKAFLGYIPTILGGIILATIFGAAAAVAVGIVPMESVINIVFPIMGGGNGGGAIPMSQIWGDVTHLDPKVWYAKAFAILSLGNLVAVLFAAILNRIGQKYPKLTGNGQLMEGMSNESPDAVKYKPELLDYAVGLGLGLVIYILADVYASHISLINTHKLGFTIHRFAFVVIFAALLNISNIIPLNVKEGAKGIQSFFARYMSFPLMITVGITTDLHSFVEVFTLGNLFVIVMVVLGAVIGTMLVGKLFHFYPVESAITAGLCMADGGGSGDVQVLGACNRMELMSFAQISSRIGGAIMLVLASIVFGLYYA